MGNSALRSLAVLEDRNLSEYSESVIAVDAHHWLYKYITGITRYRDQSDYTTEDGTEVANLVALYRGLPTLLNNGIEPIFVFDGKPHDLKQDTIDSRRESKEQAKEKMEAAIQEGDTEAIRRYKAQTTRLTETIHKTSREFLEAVGIPYVEAGGSGEAYAAQMVKEGYADCVMTDDYDALLFGSPVTIRKSSGKGPAEAMLLGPTLIEHGISQEDLVDIALLCGTDFNEGVSGIGPKRGVNYISGGKTVEEILDSRDAKIPGLADLRSIFIEPDLNDLPTRQPTMSEPDFDALIELSRDWELPESFIHDNIERFPNSSKMQLS